MITSVTFDDISPAYLTIRELKRLINFLNEVNVVCTFFVVPYESWFYPIPLPVPIPQFKKQKERLEKGLTILTNLTSVRPFGFRAPFYLHNGATLKALSNLGFRYDSSATLFKPTHGLHLRMRWLRDCKPFMREGVLEVPVSGDYTYSLKGSNFLELLRIAMRDFEYVKSRHGVFVLNNHPQRLTDVSYRFLRTFFKKLSGKTDFLKLCDVAEMYL